MDYHREHNLKIKIIRIFNTYGPNMAKNDGRVISNFVMQAINDEEITIYGDGSQTRSFCYVDDLVDGIFKLSQSNHHQPVDIGNPDEITIKQFAEEIVKLTGTTQKIIYKDLPTDDPKQRQPDITKAREILQWEPKVDRAEGLRITYDYFKSLPQEELYKKDHKTFENFSK